ncbi:hypothetical protein [Bradyrhizobium sp. AUGA SZCCT0283]|uniref:hypothetical protein n=1 Tax=Bradyrhizobium sp. AUGA SZCCT0283 TaxID=2807671 RepID=UPI001BA99E13|nr:hypothetical protein [Bradyrhizobium sp. AUGA SZCCT0283]MBR1280043.1 hypothetical protein [Bradyrhizobium sp. AUGA SZCCT0283]
MSVLSFDLNLDGQMGSTQFPDEMEVVRFLPSTTIQTTVQKVNLFHSKVLKRAALEFTQNFIYPKSDLMIGALRRRVEEFHPDIAIFIAQPYFIPLLGLQLERFSGMRRVAFFSDPWPYWNLPRPYGTFAFPLAGNYNRYLISKIYTDFDRVLYTNPSAVEFMFGNYPELKRNSNKLAIASHLADEIIETPSKEIAERVRSSVVHLGELSKQRFTPQLKTAIIECIKTHGISFTFIGSVCENLKQSLELGEFGSGVSLLGPLSDTLSRYIASIASVNLIVEANMRSNSPFLPSKLTDVLTSSDRWVFVSGTRSQSDLGVAPEGAESGICVPHDSSAIVNAILAVARSGPVNGDPCVESLRALAIERNRDLAAKFLE